MTKQLYALYQRAGQLAKRHAEAVIKATEKYFEEYGHDADADSMFMTGLHYADEQVSQEELEAEPHDQTGKEE